MAYGPYLRTVQVPKVGVPMGGHGDDPCPYRYVYGHGEDPCPYRYMYGHGKGPVPVHVNAWARRGPVSVHVLGFILVSGLGQRPRPSA